MSEEEVKNERIEPISGNTIGWWENIRVICCAVGVVLSVLIGVITCGLDQAGQPKDGQAQFEQPRVYVNSQGNLVHRKCDSSGSALSGVVTISALIIAWGYIFWLRFLIKERIKGKTWWLEGCWPDINKKLANMYAIYESVILYGALKSADYMLQWHLAWYWWIAIGIVSFLVAEIITHPLFEIILRGRMSQLERRAMYEVQREAEIKAGKPFRAERWDYPSQEMTVLGTYTTLDEARNRMVEAVEIACEQEQGLSREKTRKRIGKARRQGYYQMRDADGAIISLFRIEAPMNT